MVVVVLLRTRMSRGSKEEEADKEEETDKEEDVEERV